MTTLAQQLRGLPQLFRVKPVLSWGISAILLGTGVAVHRVGLSINVAHGGLALTAVALSQGFVSHGLNDAVDWVTGTDKESIGKGTGGSRVIPEGKMTVVGTVVAAVVALAGVVLIGAYFYQQYGTPVLVLLGIAIWSPVAYSVPPLKLGYRPFNELVVVLPALVGVVVGTDLVLTGSWSWLAVAAGWMHANYCIAWFIVSRLPDYEPDRAVGKVTSVVYLGRDRARALSAGYLGLGLAAVPVIYFLTGPLAVLGAVGFGGSMGGLVNLDPHDPEDASEVRLNNMHWTTVNGVLVAAALAVMGVY